MNDVLNEVQSTNNKLDLILKIKRNCKLPIDVSVLLAMTFKCTIYLSFIKPPAILARCCYNLLGCDKCVQNLYLGEEAFLKDVLSAAQKGVSRRLARFEA